MFHDALQAKHAPPPKTRECQYCGANYHEHYQTLIKNFTANGAASNVYLIASYASTKIKCIIMKYRTGTLYTQKHAVWFKCLISLNCSLCPQLDSTVLHSHIIFLDANTRK